MVFETYRYSQAYYVQGVRDASSHPVDIVRTAVSVQLSSDCMPLRVPLEQLIYWCQAHHTRSRLGTGTSPLRHHLFVSLPLLLIYLFELLELRSIEP